MCGRAADPEDRYCARCGTSLDRAPSAPRPASSPPAPDIDYERFFERAVDVFVVTGPDGHFRQVNPALAELLGVDRDRILAEPWSAFVHPEDRERSAAENAREFAAGHRTVTFENRYLDVDGGVHWMDWNAELDPESGLVYGIARDVTEQRAARQALEEARRAAETANRAKSDFLGRMSHELRTPLTAILGFAQILQLDDLEPEQLENLDQIIRGGRHLLQLIDEVLDISRIEMGGVPISVEPVRVSDIVADALSLLGPMATDRRIAVTSSVATDIEPTAHVLADRQRLRQVLVNFLSNALKYTPSGGRAAVGASSTDDGWLRLSVSDTGPGIPAGLQGRLFQPFERIGAEQSGIQGTGLGLAHSKALAERMGGRVGMTSAAGEGSTFWIELPRIGTPELPILDRHAVVPAGAQAVTGTVLYIEDNAANVRLVEQALAHRPGVTLMTAMIGQRGLELATRHRPELIVLDLHLPDIPGHDVLVALQGDERTRAIPVLILSADATAGQVDRLLARGARAYMTKPFDVRAFLALVDEHLGGSSTVSG